MSGTCDHHTQAVFFNYILAFKVNYKGQWLTVRTLEYDDRFYSIICFSLDKVLTFATVYLSF